MALQFATSLRNTQMDAIPSAAGATAKLLIATGSPPANCAAADSGTALITITLPASYFNAASSGAITKTGTWSGTASGGAASTPGYFRLKDNAGTTTYMQGTCAIGSGDLSFDGTITSGQTVTVSTFTVTAGGA